MTQRKLRRLDLSKLMAQAYSPRKNAAALLETAALILEKNPTGLRDDSALWRIRQAEKDLLSVMRDEDGKDD